MQEHFSLVPCWELEHEHEFIAYAGQLKKQPRRKWHSTDLAEVRYGMSVALRVERDAALVNGGFPRRHRRAVRGHFEEGRNIKGYLLGYARRWDEMYE